MLYVLAVMAAVALTAKRANEYGAKPGQVVAKGLRDLIGGLAVASILGAAVVVDAGHRGVIFNNLSGVKQEPLGEGIQFVTPFIERVVEFDVRIQKAEFSAGAASKDLQNVQTQVAINFLPVAAKTPAIYQEYGAGFLETVVHPAVAESIKSVTANYTAEQLITHREEVRVQLQNLLAERMARAHLVLKDTYITDFDFSEAFSHAIEEKQVAEQTALKAKRDLDRIIIEGQQKVSQARAEADGLKLQREAITGELLSLRRIEAQKLAIEKWDGKMPSIMLGNGSGTLINLSEFSTGK